jgi:subtilisin family serine protease
VERLTAAERAAVKSGSARAGRVPDQEPFADKQWDMRMIDATPSGSYRVNQGRRGVLVGIIDSGIDGNHPDLRDNFNRRLSRNFTTDIPLIDGPCEHPSCVDPVDEDDDGHGTHVAGLVAAELNGLGTAGMAPKVTLVNIRGGQDSGFVFLQPVVDALVYAGLVGIDVVNMSFFIDPWLYNCLDNPADSPEAQAEQRPSGSPPSGRSTSPGPTGSPRSPPWATSTPTSATRPSTTSAPTSRRAPPIRATSTTPASPSRPRPAG